MEEKTKVFFGVLWLGFRVFYEKNERNKQVFCVFWLGFRRTYERKKKENTCFLCVCFG